MINIKYSNKRMTSLKLKTRKKLIRYGDENQHPRPLQMANDSFRHEIDLKSSHAKKTHEKEDVRCPRNSVGTIDSSKKSVYNPERSYMKSVKKHPRSQKISPDFQKTKRQNRHISLNREAYSQLNKERLDLVQEKRLRNDLIQNTLQLFQLSQANLRKREVILGELRGQLNNSWKRLCGMLQDSDDGSPGIVEKALEALVKQRSFIEEENLRMSLIMETLKI